MSFGAKVACLLGVCDGVQEVHAQHYTLEARRLLEYVIKLVWLAYEQYRARVARPLVILKLGKPARSWLWSQGGLLVEVMWIPRGCHMPMAFRVPKMIKIEGGYVMIHFIVWLFLFS